MKALTGSPTIGRKLFYLLGELNWKGQCLNSTTRLRSIFFPDRRKSPVNFVNIYNFSCVIPFHPPFFKFFSKKRRLLELIFIQAPSISLLRCCCASSFISSLEKNVETVRYLNDRSGSFVPLPSNVRHHITSSSSSSFSAATKNSKVFHFLKLFFF